MRQKVASITQMLPRLPTLLRTKLQQYRFRLLPSTCVACRQTHTNRYPVCTDCTQLLTPIKNACQSCALPLPNDKFLLCGPCIVKKPHVEYATAVYRFEGPLRTVLHEFKYREGLYLSPYLASSMLEALPPNLQSTDCLIPVPMHAKKLKQRGFNQAAELTKALAKLLHIPYDLTCCEKIINTPAQASLNAESRKRNLQGAFRVKPHPYQHITLIDDLFTTGSTVNELARAFKAQSDVRVDVWCCGRA